MSPVSVLALAAAAVVTFLLVTIAYGLSAEYGDTSASALRTAAGSLRDWGIGIALAAALAGLAVVRSRGRRGGRLVRAAASGLVAVTILGVPVGAVLGVHTRHQRYPVVPDCIGEMTTGPAAPVVRAAQAGFEEIDHPGPFSGGGSSGVDGCSSQLMVREDNGVRTHYRAALRRAGWQIVGDSRQQMRAERPGQAFELTRDGESWWVWIGPAGLRQDGAPAAVVGRGSSGLRPPRCAASRRGP